MVKITKYILSTFLVLTLAIFIQKTHTYAHGFAENAVVHMNQNGFEPKELEIEKGQTVVFENQDKSPRWPASNTHPTHSIYPQFDPRSGIEPTYTWKFKFDKIGRWKYHDHLTPQFTGTIIVKDTTGSANIEGDLEESSTAKIGFFQKILDFFLGIFSAFSK